MVQEFYGYKHWTCEMPPRCFYVGKGRKNRERSRCKRSAKWKAVVRRFGLYIEICFGPATDEQACLWEIENIAKMNTFTTSFSTHDGHDIMCNFTRGGDGAAGYRHTDQAKERIRNAILGRKFSPVTLQKLRENPPMKRQESVKKMALTKTGKKIGPQSEEHKQKRAQSRARTMLFKRFRSKAHAWFTRHLPPSSPSRPRP